MIGEPPQVVDDRAVGQGVPVVEDEHQTRVVGQERTQRLQHLLAQAAASHGQERAELDRGRIQ